jgi:hypothetical protein
MGSPARKLTTNAGDDSKSTSSNIINDDDNDKNLTPLSSEDVYLQRRQRLMMMLLPASMHPEDSPRRQKFAKTSDDPPFTIQRIAEVLVAPERVSLKSTTQHTSSWN